MEVEVMVKKLSLIVLVVLLFVSACGINTQNKSIEQKGDTNNFSIQDINTKNNNDPKDITNHWAKDLIHQAMNHGWLDGYPDGTIRPNNRITRAEFVKMLASATHLTPGSETATFIVDSSVQFTTTVDVFTDIKTHWIYKQGWFSPALSFGLVIPSDYGPVKLNSLKFSPDKFITRKEIAVMVTRALGLVYPATHNENVELQFRDNIPNWLKGFVEQAVKCGVITGYPDHTFRSEATATRAEAIAMIQRSLNHMSKGADPEIKVFVKTEKDQEPYRVKLPVPVQVINHHIYVPARAIARAEHLLRYVIPYNRDPNTSPIHVPSSWDGDDQQLYSRSGVFTSGTDKVISPPEYPKWEFTLEAPAFISYSELMVPVYLVDQKQSAFFKTGSVTWDEQKKELVIYIESQHEPEPHPIS
jgi:hypothetical protein